MELKLYKKNSCPYCRRVMQAIADLDADIELHDIEESEEDLDWLLEHGGKGKQVPCLFIDGEPLYESDDIIEWLQTNV